MNITEQLKGKTNQSNKEQHDSLLKLLGLNGSKDSAQVTK